MSLGTIVPSGESVAGKPYNLTCLSSSSESEFHWFGPNNITLISNGDMESGIQIINRQNESTLYFRKIKQSHSGTYRCRVTLGGEMRSSMRNITVKSNTIILLDLCACMALKLL